MLFVVIAVEPVGTLFHFVREPVGTLFHVVRCHRCSFLSTLWIALVMDAVVTPRDRAISAAETPNSAVALYAIAALTPEALVRLPPP